MTDAPSHHELTALLARLQLGINPSDLHGSLTGYLCAGGIAASDDWLDRLALAPEEDLSGNPALRALHASGQAQFEREPPRVAPLLPSGNAPLSQRADALVEWCRGFLGGFGLAGGTVGARLSDDATEILADFGTIAASRLEVEGGPGDERAFEDVLDFVRSAVGMLHRESNPRVPRRSLH